MTTLEQLSVLAAGLGAGFLTSTVGVASLLSFPVLVAIGLPPVVANASNTVGLLPGSVSGSFGYRRELREQPRIAAIVLTVCCLGGALGAVLLLALDPSVFEAIVPWLILFTCLLVGAQPRISAYLRSRAERNGGRTDPGGGADTATETRAETPTLTPLTTFFATLTGVYGGYFGAGSGVMMVAVLGFGTDLPLRIVNGLKTLAVMAGNLVASLIFVLVADLSWIAVGLLALGSVIGGYVGAHVGRLLPDRVLRVAIMAAGVIAAVMMLT